MTSTTAAPTTTTPGAGTSAASITATANAEAIKGGIPYYEKLRRDLRETLQRKRVLDKTLSTLEDQIYKIENAYLEETSAGNIIKGFDNYIKGSSITASGGGGGSIGGLAGAGGGSAVTSGGAAAGGIKSRRGGVNDLDRVFSRSSASFSQRDPSSVSTPTSSHAGTLSHSQTPTATSFAQQPPQETTNNVAAGSAAGGGTGSGGGGGGTSSRTNNNKKGGNKKSAVNTPGSASGVAGPGGNGTGAGTEDAPAEIEGQAQAGPRKRPKFVFGGRVAGDT
ncbi:MAG: hypothetical protein M1823_001796 [Watsoniomyces obsoletus]|nr:MAG: hypothetical protein M1823_001796 [Watsoniomyces obsoletus]